MYGIYIYYQPIVYMLAFKNELDKCLSSSDNASPCVDFRSVKSLLIFNDLASSSSTGMYNLLILMRLQTRFLGQEMC